MPQCNDYPNGCNGQVKRDEKDNKWYCKKHFYNYGRMKGLGLKERKLNKRTNYIKKGITYRMTVMGKCAWIDNDKIEFFDFSQMYLVNQFMLSVTLKA